ncbi:MAG: SMP-30/gluconolactonase/LRE family protein [Candidatus Krumholzibacteriia bacterium]
MSRFRMTAMRSTRSLVPAFAFAFALALGLPLPLVAQEAAAPPDGLPPAAVAPLSARVVDAYRAAVAARQAGAFGLYRDRVAAALELEPGHPMLLLHMARACALEGDTLQAGEWLVRAAATGVQIDLSSEPDLAAVRGTAQWDQAAELVAQHAAPEGAAEIVARITEPDYLPEGIAADPVSGDLFVGSMRLRKIVRVGADGVGHDFVPAGRDGLASVGGLKVDADRRLLWACSSASVQMSGGTAADSSRTGLYAFDLESGRTVTRVMLADTTRAHFLNDCALDRDGNVYTADTMQGGVYVLRVDADRFETVVEPGVLVGANGLALSDDGRRLYVSEYALGITAVDLPSGDRARLQHPEEIAVCYTDGLLWHQGSLIVVQNGRGLDRVARLYLDESGLRVIGMTVLAARLPGFDEPTTATLAGGACLFVANSELNRFGPDGRLRPADPRRDFLIMRTPLQ